MTKNISKQDPPAESKPTAWRVGPFDVVGENWLSGWETYADENYYRVDREGEHLPLTVRVTQTAEEAYGRQTATVNSLTIERLGAHRFAIASAEAFRAELDLAQSILTLQVLAFAEAPHLILSNVLRGAVSVCLPMECDGLMFHASSGMLNDQGVFFPGISTAGKTTLALGFEHATYLSDDVTCTRDLVRQPTLCASPFFGVAGRQGANREAPLKAVGVLVSKNPERTVIQRLSTQAAVRELMRHVICWSQDVQLQAQLLSLVHSMAERVPVFAVERYIGDSSDIVIERVLDAAAKES